MKCSFWLYKLRKLSWFLPVGALAGSNSPPSKSPTEEGERSTVWPLFCFVFSLHTCYLWAAQPDPIWPIFWQQKLVCDLLCFALLTRARLLPWWVQFLPAILCQTRLSSSLHHKHIKVHTYCIYPGMKTLHGQQALPSPGFLHPLSPHLSPQVSISQLNMCVRTEPARPQPHQFVCLLHWRVGSGDVGAKN